MTTPDPKAEAEAREAPSVFDTVNAECARELDAARAARCERCLGRGIVGHMGIGHDQCPACRGLGVRAGHDVNLFLVAIALRDRLVTERDQRNAALALLDEARGERDEAMYGDADAVLRREYGREFGVNDDNDTPPCWDDIADVARLALAEASTLRASLAAKEAEVAGMRGVVEAARVVLPIIDRNTNEVNALRDALAAIGP